MIFTVSYYPQTNIHVENFFSQMKHTSGLFNVPKTTMQRNLKHIRLDQAVNGRPSLLTIGQQTALLAYLFDLFNERHYPSYHELTNWLYIKWGCCISNNTLGKIIESFGIAKTVIAEPQELERAELPKEELQICYKEVNDIPDAFVFNVDERGFMPLIGTLNVHL